MRFGLGILRLSPAEFWAMTPRELHFAMEAGRPPREAPLERDALRALMRQFPDQKRGVEG